MLNLESQHPAQFYAPLSQAMSDSESEEEIHNLSKHRQLQLRQQTAPRKTPPVSLPLNPTAKPLQYQRKLMQQQYEQLEHQKKLQLNTQATLVNGHSQSSYTTNMQNTFRTLMTDMGGEGAHYGDPTNNFSTFNSDYDERNHIIDADNVAILGNDSKSGDGREEKPMSPARRCCFIGSLMLCVFVVFGFVWLVPCSEGSACPAQVDRIKTHNWLNNYTKLELKGGVHVVNGLRHWENNLIFLYRGDKFFPEYRYDNQKQNGIISLIGSSGAVAWYNKMKDEPMAIDCTLMDVDRNGRQDCLVIDEYGELGAINPISGQWHWRYKERSAQKADVFDFPVVLPDIDGDEVLDLLLITSTPLAQRTKSYVRKGEVRPGGDQRNLLRILSGATGRPIGDVFRVPDCDVLHKLQIENELVTYTCIRNNTEAQRSKSLYELYALITNKSLANKKFVPTSKILQHRHEQRKDTDAQRNIYSLSGRELVVENRGKCPEDCNVTMILSEMRNGKVKVLRNFTNSGMYGMVPATLRHFENSKTKMSGFVMKFWKWMKRETPVELTTGKKNEALPVSFTAKKAKSIASTKDNATKSNKQTQQPHGNSIKNNQPNHQNQPNHDFGHQFPKKNFNVFEHVVQKRHAYTIPDNVRIQRDVRNMTKHDFDATSLQLDSYKMQLITETVILVLFVGADTRIENTSQSDIVQFCRSDRTESVCQPDLSNQENSMLIADLDQDGSQELVSYMTTFVQTGDDSNDWKLMTYVRLLRLQSELPAFYGTETRN